MTDNTRNGLWRRLHAVWLQLPLPPGVRAVLRQAMRRARQARASLRRSLHAAEAFRPPGTAPAAADAALPDYVIWGVIDWGFRHQRPQQLARRLSASGRRVFYIESSLQDDGRAGFAARQLDADGRLFSITLFGQGAPTIYADAPVPALVSQLRRSIGEMLLWAASGHIVSLVQHPFWCEVAAVLPHSRLVYDCMDHHEGFGNNADTILALEQQLLAQAELVSFSSAWLAGHFASQRVGAGALIRNAADYAFFCAPPAERYRDREGRRVIGYYGAIAGWFDTDLVAAVAAAFPECAVLLIGDDTAGARAQLGRYPNIRFVGEVPYSALPCYLHGFDVCLLPFRINALTLATNPVKAYEYLSAGKPVVSVDLPEMRQFEGLIHVARDAQDFVAAVGRALAEPAGDETGRRRFAADQTWEHRARALAEAAEDGRSDPSVSIIVVTCNNLALTQECLASIAADRDFFRGEVIVVDNASSDGTPEFLRQWSGRSGHHVILNDSNRGFAAANNQGLAIARGDYLVLLNNDTRVSSGWTVTLRRHLQRHPALGLIGPVTNNIGNEARINVFYRTPADMPAATRQHTLRHCGELRRLPTLAFFCVMLPRSTYEKVGPLDEAYGLGYFEDDDYCRRTEQAGLGIACAEDVFIHHHLSATFDRMDRAGRQALFAKNKAIYETKWGSWTPHRGRREQS